MKSITINYHITEKCNYSCHFCYAKYGLEGSFFKEQHHNLELTKQMLKSIYNYFKFEKMIDEIRLNFAGGEPLLLKSFKNIISIAYKIGFKLSIITNGSLLNEKFINDEIFKFSMLGISIDSFFDSSNKKIGRVSKGNMKTIGISEIEEIINLSRKINKNLKIKINTVVNKYNYGEILSDKINALAPDKWKIFKVVSQNRAIIEISDEQFQYFVACNDNITNSKVFVEDNDDMVESYIMIDPLGRFYQNKTLRDGYVISKPIVEVGAKNAFSTINFDELKYEKRYRAINEKQLVLKELLPLRGWKRNSTVHLPISTLKLKNNKQCLEKMKLYYSNKI